MISQGQVERQYNKLMAEVAISDYYKVDLTNRVNCYVCQTCRHITKTKDVDAGVTPIFFHCERCEGQAASTGYQDIAPEQKATFEWYRPTLRQLFKLRKKVGALDHIFRGGLSYRKIV